jgi:hypothetical protein
MGNTVALASGMQRLPQHSHGRTAAESGRVLGVSSDDRLAPKHLCFDVEPVPGELLYLLIGTTADFLPGCLFSHQEGRKSELRLSH